MKFLTIDDSATMRKIVMRALEQAGYENSEFLEAADGEEGLEQVSKAGEIDLIICDVNMPNMDGLEFLRVLRANSTWARIPVLMVTTESSRRAIAEAMEIGANGYVVKPFTPDMLEAAIVGLLG
ncbi:MAG: response regulator [Deltaproteobacteria bacterium]|nr:response regulator [Deltaproteobacteria bacterium]